MPSERIQVRRLPGRGAYDRAAIDAILDAGFLCHIGFVAEGTPYVIPTSYGREGDRVFFHGSAASRMLNAAAAGIEVCLTVTHFDGLVLARSGFHSSMNYRSVVVLGRARELEEEAEKAHALAVISEQILPGRWAEVRAPSRQELKATRVLALELNEASAKARRGPPIDDEADYALPVWAGVLPAAVRYGEPEADPKLSAGAPMSAAVIKARAGRGA